MSHKIERAVGTDSNFAAILDLLIESYIAFGEGEKMPIEPAATYAHRLPRWNLAKRIIRAKPAAHDSPRHPR